MSSTLPRTGLIIPDYNDTADVTIVNNNFTKIDSQIGYSICTSSTRPSAPYTGQPIYETDTGLRRYWSGSAWITFSREMQVVTSATRPASPVNGTRIYETDTQMFAIYQGSTWVEHSPASNGSTVHEAEYHQTSGQNIASGTDTPISFDTGDTITADVTRGTATILSVANAKYTLNRPGLWCIEAGLRLQNANTFSHGLWLGIDNSGAFRFAENFVNAGGTTLQGMGVKCMRRFGAATPICAYGWHSSGAGKLTDGVSQGTHIRLTWIRP